jgi:hypothetical protein
MTRRAATFAVLLGLTGLATPVMAQEGLLFKNLFEGGTLFGGAKEEIEYRERAPLVVPPQMKLPAPQQRAAERNPAWPNDPDVAAKRAANANALLPATEREKYRLDRNPTLSQDELRRGINPNQRVTAPYRPARDNAYEQLIEPIIVGREIAAQKNAKEEVTQLDAAEPTRKYLSDPPSGMRRPVAGIARVRETEAPRDNKDPTNQKEFAQGLVKR